jgi:hypothetical protein
MEHLKATNSVAAAAISIGVDSLFLQRMMPILREGSNPNSPIALLALANSENSSELKKSVNERNSYKEAAEKASLLSTEVSGLLAKMREDDNGKTFLTRPSENVSDANYVLVKRVEFLLSEFDRSIKNAQNQSASYQQ